MQRVGKVCFHLVERDILSHTADQADMLAEGSFRRHGKINVKGKPVPEVGYGAGYPPPPYWPSKTGIIFFQKKFLLKVLQKKKEKSTKKVSEAKSEAHRQKNEQWQFLWRETRKGIKSKWNRR